MLRVEPEKVKIHRVRFAGGEGYQAGHDTGLMLLGHRYYDSSTGRFLTRDSVKDGRNWYAYCSNNPVNSFDPTGTKCFGMTLGGVGGLLFHGGWFNTTAGIDDQGNVGLSWSGGVGAGIGGGGSVGAGIGGGNGNFQPSMTLGIATNAFAGDGDGGSVGGSIDAPINPSK